MALRLGVSADVRADMESYSSAISGQYFDLLGDLVIGDRSKRSYYYSALSTAIVDNDKVIGSPGMGGIGRYLKITSFIVLTTAGTGASSFDPVTGVLNIPNNSAKRQETYAGTTATTGIYSVTYLTAFTTKPNVQVQLTGGTNRDTTVLTSTPTGFNILVERRNDVIGLLPSYAPVNAAIVDVLVTER